MPKHCITKDRLGETNINNQGESMTIIKYRRCDDIDILFDSGTILNHREYRDFKNGTPIDYEYPTLYGFGILGINSTTLDNNNDTKIEYSSWCGMIERVTKGKQGIKKYSPWKDSNISTYFQRFDNFEKWYKENLWSTDCNVLDKDILIKGNKDYDVETCVLVDIRINSLFTKTNKNRGKYPVGVYYNRDKDKYVAQCSILYDFGKRQKYLGAFNSPIKAFETYKNFKEAYIKQVADEYKERYENFPSKLYNAMYSYKVEIND